MMAIAMRAKRLIKREIIELTSSFSHGCLALSLIRHGGHPDHTYSPRPRHNWIFNSTYNTSHTK
jgi:hypothetical protein